MDDEYIKSLEERVLALEKALKNIVVGENKTLIFLDSAIENIAMGKCELSFRGCSIGDIGTGSESKVQIENSPIGVVIDDQIDDAEERIEELEERLEDLNTQIDDTTKKLVTPN